MTPDLDCLPARPGLAATTEQDGANFGAHSDVERLPESSLYPFVEFTWNAVTEVAIGK